MSTNSATPKLRDAILIEFKLIGATSALTQALNGVSLELAAPTGGHQVCMALNGDSITTVYFRDIHAKQDIKRIDDVADKYLGALVDGDIEVSRLAAVRVFSGASSAEVPYYHYVVRTDVVPGGEKELERWYDEEHMPRLAAVPGVVLAQRLVSLDAAPRYYACYDLISPKVLQDPSWQAARGTDWSGRVRPTFRHTRRIVSRRLPELGV